MAKTGDTQRSGRVKHVPQRTCVACRRTDAKRGLIRLVRTAEGRVEVDSTGKRHGRGAYLCHTAACWELAMKRRTLERALRVEPLSAENQRDLLAYIRGLPIAEDHRPDDHSVDVLSHDVRV
ncbi:YlxR family protein [Oscillochloris sp. ZM17-4]|uniref:RNase P modulator RnpM n=1 Tax=Oscillochloris sp. ZM17-4 TaxID=2866714 RepID=UPI001C7351E4|nr:YlxR family protein [Oscillochloris sp. ZM17-4]MBX0326200.1 YlxR family protein [Oscillochloris sp. ZM17-4]